MHVSVCLNVYLGPAEVRIGHQSHLVGAGAQTSTQQEEQVL